MDITRVCSHVYPFIGTFHWNYIIIQLPQDWMARVKVRLSEVCRPTWALRYADTDISKLVNWTTGAYGWLESRRSIYQTSNSAKQLYKTSTLSRCLTCICFHARWGTFWKWPEVATWHSVILLALSIPRHSTTWNFHPLQHPSSERMMFRLRQPHTWWASELYVALREQSGEGQSPFRLTLWLLNSNHLFH